MDEDNNFRLSPRENLLKVFRHEQPDWIPVHIGHVGPGEMPAGFLTGAPSDLRAALETLGWDDSALGPKSFSDGARRILNDALGLDVIDNCPPPTITKYNGVAVTNTVEDGGLATVTTYKTPRGSLRQVYRRADENAPSYCVEHVVKSNDDLPALTAFFEGMMPEIDADALAAFCERKALVGDRGIVYCGLAGTPVGMMVRIYAGPENMAYLWADRGDELHRLFMAMTEYHVRTAQLWAEHGVDLIFTMDDTSTTCINPAMFQEFCMDYTDQMADAAHAHGAFHVHHSCGHIRDLLDLYRQTKMDAVDALNLAPPHGMGDIPTLAEAFERLGSNIAVLCNLGRLSRNWEPDWQRQVTKTFRDAAPGKNVLFAAKAPDFARTKVLAGECREYQRMYARQSVDKIGDASC